METDWDDSMNGIGPFHCIYIYPIKYMFDGSRQSLG